MRSSKKLLSLTFLSIIISSFAHLRDVSPSPSQIPVASGGPHISLAPATSSPAPAPSPTAGPKPLDAESAIKQWCKSTDYPDICVAAIAPFLKGKKPDLFEATSIAIKSAVEATKLAVAASNKIASSPITPPSLASLLKDASDSFLDALDNFKQAQDALVLRDWGTVNTMLSGAMTDFGDCEDQLSSQDVPILMDFSEKLTKMTSNCLALSALIDPQPGY